MSMLSCCNLQTIVPAADLVSAGSTGAAGGGAVVLKGPVGFVTGPGNFPADVASVQSLLNIASAKTGVPPLPIAVDGKFGPETIKAINAFQDAQLGFHDTVVSPGKRTLAMLNQIAAGGAAFGPLKQSALDAVPTAFSWVVGARFALAGLTSDEVRNPSSTEANAANVHFHLDRLKGSADWYLNKIRHVFGLALDVLSNGAHYFQEAPGQGFADAPMGGYHFKNSPQFNHISIRAEFPPRTLNARAAMLVHECAHFVGFVNEIRHFAMEFPAPQGQPQGSSHNYMQLTPDEAVLNASSYAAYAIHAATGQDSRFGLSEVN